jgi:hypothetical protein
MLERVREVSARRLSQPQYMADYEREFARGGDIFYKLERRQTFREPRDPSWEAFIAGDWDTVLAMLDGEDRELAARVAGHARKYGYTTQRIRVVEFPISPYLQWEMQFFRLLVEEGQDLRVLRTEQVADFETKAMLPEVVVLGEHTMYEIVYDEAGTPDGGRRIDDPEVIHGCRAELAELFEQGEPLLEFFEEHIAPLPPPAV